MIDARSRQRLLAPTCIRSSATQLTHHSRERGHLLTKPSQQLTSPGRENPPPRLPPIDNLRPPTTHIHPKPLILRGLRYLL